MNSAKALSAVQDPNRLATLRELNLLDSPAEQAFDRLTRLASLVTDSPVSLVSLVDIDRQFFKSLFGLPEPIATVRETPLSHSFCKHVVASGEPLIIADAREDVDLKDNLAIPDLNVIAYLGMPLITSEGVGLGSFCVIDSKPRTWTEREIEIVRELAVSTMTEIELRAAQRRLTDRNQQYRRVHQFSSTTLENMRDIVNRGGERKELLEYIKQMEQEFNRL